MHPLAKARGDVDQRIKREARHTAPQQLIDAWLRHAAMLGRFKLRPAVLLNRCRDVVSQACCVISNVLRSVLKRRLRPIVVKDFRS